MIPYCDFSEQVSMPTEEARLRPDMIVNLPGGKQVVVDAKTPLQAYLDALDTESEPQRQQLMQAHARHVRAISPSVLSSIGSLTTTPGICMFRPESFSARWSTTQA